jgi:hypothetical protein
MWADQIRRADERSAKFRQDANNLTVDNHKLSEQNKLL